MTHTTYAWPSWLFGHPHDHASCVTMFGTQFVWESRQSHLRPATAPVLLLVPVTVPVPEAVDADGMNVL